MRLGIHWKKWWYFLWNSWHMQLYSDFFCLKSSLNDKWSLTGWINKCNCRSCNFLEAFIPRLLVQWKRQVKLCQQRHGTFSLLKIVCHFMRIKSAQSKIQLNSHRVKNLNNKHRAKRMHSSTDCLKCMVALRAQNCIVYIEHTRIWVHNRPRCVCVCVCMVILFTFLKSIQTMQFCEDWIKAAT